MNSRKSFALAFIIPFIFSTLFAQVSISPTSAFLDSKQRFETILIRNNSDEAQEVKLAFDFAYPKATAEGDIQLIYDDVQQEILHSASDWLRGFPKNFVLEPGGRQVVRVTAKAPRDIEPGVYWSRLVTTTSAVAPEIGATDPTSISTQITMQFRQVTSIFYKSGELTTGLELTGIRPLVDGKQLKVFVDYTKNGNAPFLGTMRAEVYDAAGKIIADRDMYVSIYYDGLRRINVDVSDLAPGTYDLKIKMKSGRSDIPDNKVVPAEEQTIKGIFTKI